MVINKTAKFSVMYARNLVKRAPEVQQQILDDMDPRARSLITIALRAVKKQGVRVR